MSKENRFAGDGEIWMCCACGKTSKDQYGIEGEHSYGWDESCMLNSVLVLEKSVRKEADGSIFADAVVKEVPSA